MSSRTEDRIQALEIALNNESKERDFYLQHSARTKNSIGKLMFTSIAADEDEHYKRILDLHKKLISEKKWPETVPIKVKGTEVKAVFNTMGEWIEKSAKADADDLEAVKIAIGFETKGELFYAKLAKEVDNPMEKNFYAFLAGIEREHRLSLEDTYEYFQDPAGWLRIKERHHIDGA
jgi:rubrerythrin